MFTMVLCLFIAVMLPMLAKGPVAAAMHKLGGYNNKHPRAQQAQLTGFGARALAAHQNAFEAVIMFAPAALSAMIVGVSKEMELAAMVFIGARVVYNLLYLANLHLFRSLTWAVGLGCTVYIFWQVLVAL